MEFGGQSQFRFQRARDRLGVRGKTAQTAKVNPHWHRRIAT